MVTVGIVWTSGGPLTREARGGRLQTHSTDVDKYGVDRGQIVDESGAGTGLCSL